MSRPPSAGLVNTVRLFNSFYVRRMGLLRESPGPFSRAELRILYEIAAVSATTARDIGQSLGLDATYLSRALGAFQEAGLIRRRVAPEDRRSRIVSLTTAGRAQVAELEKAGAREAKALLTPLGDNDRVMLAEGMRSIQAVLGEGSDRKVPFTLRGHRAGDMGWITWRHGVLYSREHGWTDRFEALVARIAADFLLNFDAARERCWIAERDGTPAGCVILAAHRKRKGVAQLRLLLVEPDARGMGIGTRLVQECSSFARESGYHAISLWTSDVLHSARRLYEQEGYSLVEDGVHDGYGLGLVGQTWELQLNRTKASGEAGRRRHV